MPGHALRIPQLPPQIFIQGEGEEPQTALLLLGSRYILSQVSCKVSGSGKSSCRWKDTHTHLSRFSRQYSQARFFDIPEVLTTFSTLMIKFIRKGRYKVFQVSQFQRPPNVFIRMLVKRIKIHTQRARKQYWILVIERGN